MTTESETTMSTFVTPAQNAPPPDNLILFIDGALMLLQARVVLSIYAGGARLSISGQRLGHQDVEFKVGQAVRLRLQSCARGDDIICEGRIGVVNGAGGTGPDAPDTSITIEQITNFTDGGLLARLLTAGAAAHAKWASVLPVADAAA